MERQCYREHRSSALRIAYRYGTLHCRYELAHYPQSNAEAATTIILSDRPLKTIKNALSVSLGDAGTVIPDLEADPIAYCFGADVHQLTSTVFDRVGHEVVENLLHRQTVKGSRETCGRIDADCTTRVVGSVGVRRDHVSYDVAQIAGAGLKRELSAGQTGDIKKGGGALHVVAHHASQSVEPLLNLLGRILARPHRREQQLDETDHRRHRVTQLVGSDGDERVPGSDRLGQFGIAPSQVVKVHLRRRDHVRSVRLRCNHDENKLAKQQSLIVTQIVSRTQAGDVSRYARAARFRADRPC